MSESNNEDKRYERVLRDVELRNQLDKLSQEVSKITDERDKRERELESERGSVLNWRGIAAYAKVKIVLFHKRGLLNYPVLILGMTAFSFAGTRIVLDSEVATASGFSDLLFKFIADSLLIVMLFLSLIVAPLYITHYIIDRYEEKARLRQESHILSLLEIESTAEGITGQTYSIIVQSIETGDVAIARMGIDLAKAIYKERSQKSFLENELMEREREITVLKNRLASRGISNMDDIQL